MTLSKILSFFNLRKHYKNRIKQRNGSHLLFILSKKIDEKQVLDGSKTKCEVWKFRKNLYITQNYQMQTYIKLSTN